MFGSDYYDDNYRYRKRKITYKDRGYDDRRHRSHRSLNRDGAYYGSTAGRVATTASQVCGACGKFRSPSWSSRHPLRYGEVPRSGLCRKCAAKSTSSERSVCSRRPKRVHQYPRARRHYTDCTDDYYSSVESRDPCYLRRRYRSDSLGYIRPRTLVSVASSDDLVRVSRRALVDRPIRRGILKPPSTCSVYSDEIVERVIQPRRSLRHTRTRSGSSVRFVDELERPYHRRPRSSSRRSSREEVVVSRPRSYSRRRRPVYYDGPADLQDDEVSRNSIKEEDRRPSLTRNGKDPEHAGNSNVLPKSDHYRTAYFKPIPLISQARTGERTCTTAVPLKSSRSQFSQDIGCSSDKPGDPHDDAKAPTFNDQARVAFADYNYEVDSHFPSPPLVYFSQPENHSRSFSPLHLSPKPLPPRESKSPYLKTYRPSCTAGGTANAASGQRKSDHVLDSSISLDDRNSLRCTDTPPTSVTSIASSARNSGISKANLMASPRPEQPEQTDDLADLLSTTRIAPRYGRRNSPGLPAPRSRDSSCESLATTWRYNLNDDYIDRDDASLNPINQTRNIKDTSKLEAIEKPRERKHSWRNYSNDNDDAFGQQSELYHSQASAKKRATTLHDIFDEAELEQKYNETVVDYEAEGRAYMDRVRRERETMRGRGVVDAVDW